MYHYNFRMLLKNVILRLHCKDTCNACTTICISEVVYVNLQQFVSHCITIHACISTDLVNLQQINQLILTTRNASRTT